MVNFRLTFLLVIALTIVSILVHALPGIGNTSDSELSKKPYMGYHALENKFKMMDQLIKKKKYSKAIILLDRIQESKEAEECMPQAICHAIRFYEDHIPNESGAVNLYPKITGVYRWGGAGGAYEYFCVRQGNGEKCFTAYSGCKYVGKPEEGRIVTVYYSSSDDERAVKVVVHRKTRK